MGNDGVVNWYIIYEGVEGGHGWGGGVSLTLYKMGGDRSFKAEVWGRPTDSTTKKV